MSSSKNILEKILETKRKELEEIKTGKSLAEFKSATADMPPTRDFYAAVAGQPAGLVNLIAEVKRASPSAGVIKADFDPVAIARIYEQAGANAISVLTDEQYFHGKLEYLQMIRRAVAIPLLRKDFLIDPLQVYQSRIAGADAILLIAAALTDGLLSDMLILASELKMTCLIEVHDADEMLRVRSLVGFPLATSCILGINNRDLRTFHVDINTTVRLAELAGEGAPLVSESGIATRHDVEKVASAGVHGILVGQTLMQSADVPACVRQLIGK